MEEKETKEENKAKKHRDPSKTEGFTKNPLSAWFLGPKAENSAIWKELLNYIFDDYVHWRRNYFPKDPIVVDRIKRRNQEFWFDKLTMEIDTILNELKAHYPFYSPRYIAHMLSEQTLPAVVGYFAGMLYNPNNVTDEAAPVTVPLEIEAGKMVADMLGYNSNTSWTHITSGGTIANLEALWVARTIQFSPLIVKDYCLKNNIDFKIQLPKHDLSNKVYAIEKIIDVDNIQLLKLKPNESIFMFRKLASYLINNLQREQSKVLSSINKFIQSSEWNIAEVGTLSLLKKLDLVPKIFVSEAAHYSINKLANVLGYGENNVVKIPVDSNFRMNIAFLNEKILSLKKNELIAGVIGIFGSTEEGAIDPIHEIKFLRDELQQNENTSFWFHIDAAWGGYMKSLFNHPDLKKKENTSNLDEICQIYKEKLDIKEVFDLKLGDKTIAKDVKIEWDDDANYKAILATGVADSITIDPHKLGYIPYPAGMVSFKNGLVTEHIKQEAQYISDEKGGVKNIDTLPNISAVGPYILEGSKPGAAAASTWLAHKAIPLDIHGHGKIIRTTLLNSKKLCRYIDFHKHIFNLIERFLNPKATITDQPFTFKYLYTPDSNVVCFIAQPMKFKQGTLDDVDCSLKRLNQINTKLYKKLSINDSITPYNQEFFVSRTTFTKKQYSYNSISLILDRLGISKQDYDKYGLFVLRSTVMNPWHWNAQLAGKDYLFEFIINMHKHVKEIVEASR